MFSFGRDFADWLDDFLQRGLLVGELFLSVFGTTRSLDTTGSHLVERRGRGQVLVLVEVTVVVGREVRALQRVELVHGVRPRLKNRGNLLTVTGD